MESSDEKFFEELAGQKIESDEDLKVELAKAGAGTVYKPRLEAKEIKEAPARRKNDEPEGQLTLDVYQTPTDIIVESAIAGVRPEDIDINVTTDSVAIRGERHREKEAGDEDYFYQECYWGKFSRSVILPQEIDPESAEVSLKNGILKIRLPKLNRTKAKKLKVKVE